MLRTLQSVGCLRHDQAEALLGFVEKKLGASLGSLSKQRQSAESNVSTWMEEALNQLEEQGVTSSCSMKYSCGGPVPGEDSCGNGEMDGCKFRRLRLVPTTDAGKTMFDLLQDSLRIKWPRCRVCNRRLKSMGTIDTVGWGHWGAAQDFGIRDSSFPGCRWPTP